MPEENGSQAHVGDDTVPTYEELEASFDDLMANFGNSPQNDTPVEEPTVKADSQKPPAEEDRLAHEESSRLGRKVAWLSENMVTKSDFEEIKSLLKGSVPKNEEEHFDEEIDLNTPEGLAKFMDAREERKKLAEQQARKNFDNEYQRIYVGVMSGLLEQIPDEGKRVQVRDELFKHGGKFNVRHSDNAASDCTRNFTAALKSLTPTNVFQKDGRSPNLPTGSVGNTQDSKKTAMRHDLDAEAADYVKRMGLSPEFVNSAFEGETPVGLRGKRG